VKHVSVTARMDAECAAWREIDHRFELLPDRPVQLIATAEHRLGIFDWRQRRSKRIADLLKEREHA
jgi:hypothetical protein